MRLILTLAALALAAPAAAHAASDISVDHGAIWQTVTAGDTTQGFIEIHNAGSDADVLTAWDCSIADTTTLVDAKGKPLASLTIPAGKTVTLAPTGPHLLLKSTHYTVDYGSNVPCSLTFQEAGLIGGYLDAVPAP
jgi:copper(I)-binding protein